MTETPSSKPENISLRKAKRSLAKNIMPKKSGSTWSKKDIIALLALIVSLVSLAVSIHGSMTAANVARISLTFTAVNHLLHSPENWKLNNKISGKTKGGTDYSLALTDNDLKNAINHHLNELETIAQGVNRKNFDEATVFENIASFIYKYVKAHLKGERGTIPSGSWIANQRNEPLFPSKEQFPELRKLYEKWFPDGTFYSDWTKKNNRPAG